MDQEHPQLAAFSSIAEARIGTNYHDGFFSLEQDFGNLVFNSNFLSDVAHNTLSLIADDPSQSLMTWEPNNIVIANHPHWQLRVSVYKRTPDFLYSLPYHLMIAIVGSRPLQVDHYALPKFVDKAIFDPHAELAQQKSFTYRPGSIFKVDSRSDVAAVRVEEPVIAVKLNSAIHDPLQWAFCRNKRTAVQAIAADPVDSDLVSIAQALGQMERAGATEGLNDLASHPRHFVRWAAIQALGRIAPDIAVRNLRRAVNDSHPHIRTGAKAALATLTDFDQ